MDMYRRIATIDTSADRVDVLDELEDRYGDLPAQTGTLADIAYIRAAAGRLGFSRVSQNAGGVVLAFADGRKPDMGVLARAMNLPAYKGRLLFNAGTKPYLLFRGAATDKAKATESVRGLLEALE
jgi:transcription-repair coupling factor (superfamily II helicase)